MVSRREELGDVDEGVFFSRNLWGGEGKKYSDSLTNLEFTTAEKEVMSRSGRWRENGAGSAVAAALFRR